MGLRRNCLREINENGMRTTRGTDEGIEPEQECGTWEVSF